MAYSVSCNSVLLKLNTLYFHAKKVLKRRYEIGLEIAFGLLNAYFKGHIVFSLCVR